MIPESAMHTIRALPIAEVLADRGHLSQGRGMYLCPLPSHPVRTAGKRTPSFSVTESVNLWRCHSEDFGGDLIRLVAALDNTTDIEAARTLAARYGIAIDDTRPARGATRPHRAPVPAPLPLPDATPPRFDELQERLAEVCHAASQFFASLLESHAVAKGARDYLTARGVPASAYRPWAIGYCPPGGIANHMASLGFTAEELQAAGLVSARGVWPLAGRIVFAYVVPVLVTEDGADFETLRTVGFTARALPGTAAEESAKYTNTPTTAVFSKGSCLLGYGLASYRMALTGRVVLVEGPLDALACWQAPCLNTRTCAYGRTCERFPRCADLSLCLEVMATCGGPTEGQAALIARNASHVVTLFDADAAGDRFRAKAAELFARAPGVALSQRTLPGGPCKDAGTTPADVLAEYLREPFDKARALDAIHAANARELEHS